MKQLLILRHAKSSWADDSLADFDRPLNKRGKRDAPRMGRLLAQEDLTPDLIITSSAKRAQLTAEAVADSSGYDGDIMATRAFYLAAPDEYIEVLNQASDSNNLVMVVGHNPGVEYLVQELTGAWERMPTAALAYIELAVEHWRDLEIDTAGKLQAVWLPKEL